jgi:hypothetical protein
MMVGAKSGRGPHSLFKVPVKTKVKAQWDIGNVLMLIYQIHISRFYGSESSKFILHHDKKTSHTAKKTVQYAKEVRSKWGVTFIKNQDIHVKGPDMSPMDFFGFAFLKQRFWRRRST